MSERKVLNKYYPPDFDPTKIPKIRRPKNFKKGVFSIRLMAPFNMRCNTCGEYIYKGKKFNSRKETVENENYLGLHIFRFYIKCPRCIAEIAFKTDPVNTDYELEAGATRNFEATRTAEKMALQEQKEKEAEEANNPMKLLENRTKASCQEMEMLETLEDLRELRHRHSGINVEKMLQQNKDETARLMQLQEQEDEEFVKSIFGRDGTGIVVKRINSDDEEEDDDNNVADAAGGSDDEDDNDDDVNGDGSSSHSAEPATKISRLMAPSPSKPSDILTEGSSAGPSTSKSDKGSAASSAVWNRSVGSMKCKLSGLVRPKTTSSTSQVPCSADLTISVSSSSVNTSTGDSLVSQASAELPQAQTAAAAGKDTLVAVGNAPVAVKSAGLAGLGAYSSSTGDSDSDNV